MTEHLPLILATFLLAGMVKGVVGLGLPTIAVGLIWTTVIVLLGVMQRFAE